ncbi:unnamed protein product [Notodromas monacha]|uniref:Uncharacterized protein n=1 Tax=Notodromas monacha TaxID=399045 RepID=A0A7R9GIZ9_9CRUS|nr:unnamed protein product [Notodromas monacha]CAG0922356.1 unnamed protein product [Notodromas monacha]
MHKVMARSPQNRSMQIQFSLGAEGLGNHGFPQIGCKNTKRTVSSAVTAIFLVSWVSLTTSVSASPVRIVSHAYRSNPVSVASSPVYPIVQQSLLRSPANTNRPTALQSTQSFQSTLPSFPATNPVPQPPTSPGNNFLLKDTTAGKTTATFTPWDALKANSFQSAPHQSINDWVPFSPLLATQVNYSLPNLNPGEGFSPHSKRSATSNRKRPKSRQKRTTTPATNPPRVTNRSKRAFTPTPPSKFRKPIVKASKKPKMAAEFFEIILAFVAKNFDDLVRQAAANLQTPAITTTSQPLMNVTVLGELKRFPAIFETWPEDNVDVEKAGVALKASNAFLDQILETMKSEQFPTSTDALFKTGIVKDSNTTSNSTEKPKEPGTKHGVFVTFSHTIPGLLPRSIQQKPTKQKIEITASKMPTTSMPDPEVENFKLASPENFNESFESSMKLGARTHDELLNVLEDSFPKVENIPRSGEDPVEIRQKRQTRSVSVNNKSNNKSPNKTANASITASRKRRTLSTDSGNHTAKVSNHISSTTEPQQPANSQGNRNQNHPPNADKSAESQKKQKAKKDKKSHSKIKSSKRSSSWEKTRSDVKGTPMEKTWKLLNSFLERFSQVLSKVFIPLITNVTTVAPSQSTMNPYEVSSAQPVPPITPQMKPSDSLLLVPVTQGQGLPMEDPSLLHFPQQSLGNHQYVPQTLPKMPEAPQPQTRLVDNPQQIPGNNVIWIDNQRRTRRKRMAKGGDSFALSSLSNPTNP